MKIVLFLSLCFFTLIGKTQVDPAPCTDLFFSEYIEGSSFNKGLEIYNPTTNTIVLTNYTIRVFFNGATTTTSNFFPQGTLAPGQTYTICHQSSAAGLLSVADTTCGGVSIMSFNGNDAIVLYHGIDTIDIIGEVGVDPGTSWPVGSGSTIDHTLRRQPAIQNGNNVWAGDGDLTYDSYAIDTYSDFGMHTYIPCPLTPLIADFSFTTVCHDSVTSFFNSSTGGTGPYTFSYDFNDLTSSTLENPTHIYLASGCYNVRFIITDALGNDDTLIQSVCVVPLDNPALWITDTVLCNDSFGMNLYAGDTSGTWSGTYVFDSGAGNGFFSSGAIAPGHYQAIYNTNGMCPNADTLNIYVPVPPVSSYTYTNAGLNFSFTNTSTNASTYLWSFGSLGTSTAMDTSYTFPSTAASYNVCLQVTSDSGCVALSCQTITITGINEVMKEGQVNLYPNPASDLVNINAPVNTIIEIRNLAGQVVTGFTTNKQNTIVDTHNWPSGIYSVDINKSSVVKLVVVR